LYDPYYPFNGGSEHAHAVTSDTEGDVVVIASLHRAGNPQAVIKLAGGGGETRWIRPVYGRLESVTASSLGSIAVAGLNSLIVNEWDDRAFGFWVTRLDPSGDGLAPVLVY
jgi:hypothetical protein